MFVLARGGPYLHIGARVEVVAHEPSSCDKGRMSATVLVAAGVVIEGGRVLLSQRKATAHLGGAWELPGGKVHAGEDPREALRRELREELGIEVAVGEILDVTFHQYDDSPSAMLLLFFLATRLPTSPSPQPLDVAAFEWAGLSGLDPARFPAADVGVVAKVRALLA
jgi:8-oxo-dGTP diphosphatase